jgi:hypothetical protein
MGLARIARVGFGEEEDFIQPRKRRTCFFASWSAGSMIGTLFRSGGKLTVASSPWVGNNKHQQSDNCSRDKSDF